MCMRSEARKRVWEYLNDQFWFLIGQAPSDRGTALRQWYAGGLLTIEGEEAREAREARERLQEIVEAQRAAKG